MLDFTELQNALDEEIQIAAKQTNEKLASKASSLTRLTDQEIKDLFPTPADVQKLRT